MKSLIIYYSRKDENYGVGYVDKGNTEILADYIKDITNSDVIKVEPGIPYAKDYATCIKEAKDRISTHNAPFIASIVDLSKYDLIYIGSPVYWSYMPEELTNYLKEYNWSNKSIKLFVTHEGSGFASIPSQVAQVCNGADIVDKIEIQGKYASASKEKILSWINK